MCLVSEAVRNICVQYFNFKFQVDWCFSRNGYKEQRKLRTGELLRC